MNEHQQLNCRRLHLLSGSVLALFVLLISQGVLQGAWNVQLQREISQLREDVAMLKELAYSRADVPLPTQEAEKVKEDKQTFVKQTAKPKSTNVEKLDKELVETFPMETLDVHFLKKRNTETSAAESDSVSNIPSRQKRSRRKKKKKSKKDFTEQDSLPSRYRRHIDIYEGANQRKNKAIAIHVQAGSDETPRRISTPGKDVSSMHASMTADVEDLKERIRGVPLTNWRTPDPRFNTFETGSLRSNGRITVRAKGVYFVYSQVVFRTSDIPNMVAEIGVKTMAQTTFAKCQSSRISSGTNYVTCNSNGVVYLNANEQIALFVNSGNVNNILTSPEHTYFGAFYVGR